MADQFKFSAKRRHPGSGLEVILGGHTVKAFVAAPKAFHVVGIVRLGMEYGLLAKTETGNYMRVNGSLVQDLDRQQVETAIAKICTNGRGESYAATRSHVAMTQKPCTAPTVTIRKHRKIEQHNVAYV